VSVLSCGAFFLAISALCGWPSLHISAQSWNITASYGVQTSSALLTSAISPNAYLHYHLYHTLKSLLFLISTSLNCADFGLILSITIKCLITSHPLTPVGSSLCIPLPRSLDLKCHSCRNQLKSSSQPFSLEALMRGTLYQQLCNLLPFFLYLNDTKAV
jgi:hypothetical protein